MVQEGNLQPSADEVAKRAGVSRRSIFNHFGDLAELYDAVVEVGMQRCEPLLASVSEDATAKVRVEEIVELRATFFEATAAFTRALIAQSLVGSAAEQAQRVSLDAVQLQFEDINQVFGKDLETLPARERAEILEALSAAASPVMWEYLRQSRGKSLAASKAIVQRSLSAILRDAGVDL